MPSIAPDLDPDAQAILDVIGAERLPHLATLSVGAARQRVHNALVSKKAPLPLTNVEDRAIPSPSGPLPIRLYRPVLGSLPMALFLHGGGWTLNDLDTHDDLCRKLARQSGWLVAALGFRRAPEHKHPAALADACIAYRWLLDHAREVGGDPACCALIGESSGGTTSASLSLLLRDLGAPMPSYQVIAYPVMDQLDRWPSYSERGSGYILDRELMSWYLDQYLPPDFEDGDPYLFPLVAPDLTDMPPTLMLTAEFDPLRDEGIAYANRLVDAGVTVEHVHVSDQMHGFLLLSAAVPKAAALVSRVADTLARARPRSSLNVSMEPQFYLDDDGQPHMLT